MRLYQNDGNWMFCESLDWKEQDRLREGLSLDKLRKLVDGLIAAHGKEAKFTVLGDIERPATEAEVAAHKVKLVAEAEVQRKRIEERERAEYERLRAKFETPSAGSAVTGVTCAMSRDGGQTDD